MLLAAGALHYVNMLEIIRHPWFMSASCAFFGAQLLKFALVRLRSGQWHLHEMISPGGMPSAHAALATSLASAVGFTDGFDAPYAMVALGFGALVLCDAVTIRFEAGEHAKLLNKIVGKLNEMLDPKERIEASRLKERLGHKRREVTVGAVFGVLVAFVVCAIWDFWK